MDGLVDLCDNFLNDANTHLHRRQWSFHVEIHVRIEPFSTLIQRLMDGVCFFYRHDEKCF